MRENGDLKAELETLRTSQEQLRRQNEQIKRDVEKGVFTHYDGLSPLLCKLRRDQGLAWLADDSADDSANDMRL